VEDLLFLEVINYEQKHPTKAEYDVPFPCDILDGSLSPTFTYNKHFYESERC
jgi:hypothetical protein